MSMRIGMVQDTRCGDSHRSMWSKMYLEIGAATFHALNLLYQNDSASDCVCVWLQGNRVQQQTGKCRLGSSGVRVGTMEMM